MMCACLIAMFVIPWKQQAKSALAVGSAEAARQLPAGSQVRSEPGQPVRKPTRPIIEVDASCVPQLAARAAAEEQAKREEGGPIEGWGLNHPEMS